MSMLIPFRVVYHDGSIGAEGKMEEHLADAIAKRMQWTVRRDYEDGSTSWTQWLVVRTDQSRED